MSSSIPSSLSSFQGDLVFPEDPAYPSSISRWASNAQRLAALVAFPKSTSDIGLILQYALVDSKPALPIAIKCGGHSASGASSVEGGVVIDLSRYFAGVKVDPEKRLAYVGGGALWKTVDETAMEHGLATVGGIVNHTGVGGLTLGGGFGFLTGEHGLTIDNLVQATITLASGETCTISSDENPDLFWAIRGAGSNFGVITEFVLRLHPQRQEIYSGILVFPMEKVEELCKVASNWWNNGKGPSEKERLFINTCWSEEVGAPVIQAVPFFNGSESEGREVFKEFLSLNPTQDLTSSIPYPKLNAASNALFPHGRPYITTGYRAHTANPESIKNVAALFKRFKKDDEARKNDPSEQQVDLNVVVIHEFTPFAKFLSIPKTETPFPRERVNNGFLIATWGEDSKQINEKAKTMVKEVKDVFQEDERKQGGDQYVTSHEQNASVEQDFRQSPTAKLEDLFGPENYQRLKELKRKYDPGNVFSRWLKIEA